MRFSLLSILVLLVAGCAHDFSSRCLDPDVAAKMLSDSERFVDRAAKVSEGTTEIVENACWKRKYRRSGNRIVLYKTPSAAPTEIQTILGPERQGVAAPEPCLADAERTIESLRLPHVTQLFSRVRSKHDWRWLDPDIGPSKWLECKAKRSERYYEHVETLVHELTHDAKEGVCLFVPVERTRRCFQLPKELLPARETKLRFVSPDPSRQDTIEWVLDLYLGKDSAATVLTLLDELNAYTVGTDVRVAVLEKVGRSGLFDARGRRDLSFLPLFLAQTAAYLASLKAKTPALYQETFGVAKENHAHVAALFDNAEKSFEAWRKVASGPRDSAARVEAELMSVYRKLKAGL